MKEIEFIIKNLPIKKTTGQVVFYGDFNEERLNLREKLRQYYKSFQTIGWGKTLPD